MLYESILLFAVALAATSLFQLAVGPSGITGWRTDALHAYLLAVFAAYFLWCWLRGGQTLAMKAWRIRVVAASGAPLVPRVALLRFVLATVFVGGFLLAVLAAIKFAVAWFAFLILMIASAGLAWAWVDRDRQFLHDRIAGTRLVLVEPPRRAENSG
jgi:uncharacterized RDD family membrane protein YckC